MSFKVSKRWLQALKQIEELAQSLESEETSVMASMDPDVREVTKGKAICLFRALLKQMGFPDPDVADMLVEGVPLVGEEPASSLFAKHPRPMAISPEQLMAQSTLRRNPLRHERCLMDPRDLADWRLRQRWKPSRGS